MLHSLLENQKNTTLVLITTTGVIVGSYLFINWFRLKRYFKSLNIPSGPTPLPIFGNLFEFFKKGFVYFHIQVLEKYGKKQKIIGYFEGSTPVVLCANPDMIKHVMIKDFNYFVNRRSFEAFDMEPFNKFLTSLKDDEWKSVRSILTTTFTSGKLKGMSKMVIQCSDVALKYIDDIVEKDQYFEAKTVFGSFTIDVISSCCFGVQTDAFNDPNSEFMTQLKKVFQNELSPKFLLLFLFPKFSKYVQQKQWMTFFPFDSLNYLGEIVNQIFNRRKSKVEHREDFIQNMVEHEESTRDDVTDKSNDAKKETDQSSKEWKSLKKTLSTKEILAQAIIFLTAGYDTTATSLSFVAYNLARNPDCQKKLCLEIDEAFQKHGSLSYDMVHDIPYLDMVINESLRMFPPALGLDRCANADYTYKDMKIPKGTIWTAAIYVLHHDPEYYPDPETFNPERFTPELKKQRESDGTYIPFGSGPRNCIGMRFAMIEMKIILCAILSKYEFRVCDKTPTEFNFVNNGLLRTSKPVILKIAKRTEDA